MLDIVENPFIILFTKTSTFSLFRNPCLLLLVAKDLVDIVIT